MSSFARSTGTLLRFFFTSSTLLGIRPKGRGRGFFLCPLVLDPKTAKFV
jgi:predicted RNA-binding protein YlxR (DUF448 family)